MTGFLTELILRECMEKAQAEYDSSLAKSMIEVNAKIKLSEEHLKELQNNAYSGLEEADVIDHIAKVLEILNSIKILNVDTDRRMHVFPLSLTGDARKWWINEGSGKITAWSVLVGRFFCKCYPLSHAGKNNVISNDEDDRSDYFEFVKGWGNDELIDDIVSSDEEWEESYYGNPPNTNTDSFCKPYLDAQEKDDICLIEKEHHLKNHSSDVSVQNSASCFDDKKMT
ncbi:hypothetical protein Tco_1240478 [Tanacetum coccineum]